MPTAVLDEKEHVKPFDEKARPLVAPSKYWKDLGWNDPVVKGGRWRFFYYPIREKDPQYYDPTITESMIGPGGLEQERATEMGFREMPSSVSMAEWRDRRYFLDPNIKYIYENYPIAKQHPGIGFRPNGTEMDLQHKEYIGRWIPSVGLFLDWPGIMPQNWKFFGAPFGEDCHVKTAACAKYGLFAGTGYFIWRAQAFYLGRGWRFWLQKWYYYNTWTVPIAAAWAAASCISCSLRGKDDAKNMWAGGAAVGAIIGMRKGFVLGLHRGLAAAAASALWYYVIAFEQGLGISRNPYSQPNIFSYDPAAYKWAQWESNMWEPQPYNF